MLLLYYCFTTALLQGAFIEAIAAAAGALKEDVSIKSVREVASRRGGSARRAGTSASSLRLTYADVCSVSLRMLTDMPDVPVPAGTKKEEKEEEEEDEEEGEKATDGSGVSYADVCCVC